MNTKDNPKFLRWFNFFSYFIFSSPILVLFFNSVLDNYALSMTIYAAQSISCSLLEIPFGIISDRIGRKNIMVMGAITRLLCFVIWAMSYSFVPLLLGAIIGGASDALASGGSDYHSPSKINRELGMYGDIDNRKPIPIDILDKLFTFVI